MNLVELFCPVDDFCQPCGASIAWRAAGGVRAGVVVPMSGGTYRGAALRRVVAWSSVLPNVICERMVVNNTLKPFKHREKEESYADVQK